MYCLDASVITNSFIIREEFHEFSKKLMDKIREKDISVVLPEIVLPEVASAIGRGVNNEKIALAFVETMRKIPNFTFIPIDRELSLLSSRFAAENRLRGCDAVYVAVAYLFDAKLITLDRQQKERANGLIEAMTPMEEVG